MNLESELKKLKNSEVGTVEKTIREIEDSKFDTEQIVGNKKSIKEDCRELIIEKLPQIINNICIMKDYIPKINGYNLSLEKNNRYSTLKIKNDPGISIIFENDEIKEISLYEKVWSDFLNIITLSHVYTKNNYLIKAKTPAEFAEKFADRIFPNIEKESSYEIRKLIDYLFDVHSKIKEEYLEIKKKEEKEKDKIIRYKKKLESMDVSDF